MHCRSLLAHLLLLLLPTPLLAAHGVSLDGDLKYPADFERFAYTSPEAKEGGDLTLHDIGSFDKLNPFTLKGQAPLAIEFLVFEPLAVASWDEPFSQYGLIAKDITLADDRLSVTFTLDERARFSDGTPVTARDVKYTLDSLKSDDAHPLYQIYLQDIAGAEVLDAHRVRFNFARVNRELHMIAAQLPVLSAAHFERVGFNRQTPESVMAVPVGSGPYIVDQIVAGKSIRYRKNPDYWASDHPTRRGMFNFETITVKYFKDQVVSIEAFKAGEFDVLPVNIAKQWQRDLTGRRFDSGQLVKKAFLHHNSAGMQGFLFNTRNPLFQNRRVRQALGLALDFEWTNATLFFDQYTRTNSYFANSELAATGLPEGRELALLEPYRTSLPPEVFTDPLAPPTTKPPSSLRSNLRLAQRILQEEGWQVKDGVLTDGSGAQFRFNILLANQTFERVMAPYTANLGKLGIQAEYRTIDPALYADRVKNFDFDMVVAGFGQSQSPGNEQREFWGSAAADRKGSRNLAGIKDPAIDHLIDAVIYAQTRAELTAACRALDRVLWYGYYVVPNWYLNKHRYAFRSDLRQPSTLPLYYDIYQYPDTWWYAH